MAPARNTRRAARLAAAAAANEDSGDGITAYPVMTPSGRARRQSQIVMEMEVGNTVTLPSPLRRSCRKRTATEKSAALRLSSTTATTATTASPLRTPRTRRDSRGRTPTAVQAVALAVARMPDTATQTQECVIHATATRKRKEVVNDGANNEDGRNRHFFRSLVLGGCGYAACMISMVFGFSLASGVFYLIGNGI